MPLSSLDNDPPKLCESLDDEDAWHHRIAREVTLEKFFIDGDGFDPCRTDIGFELVYPVDQQEGVTMREDGFDLASCKRGRNNAMVRHSRAIPSTGGVGRAIAVDLVVAVKEGARKVGVERMAALDRLDVGLDGCVGEEEITEEVKNLVANKFILEAKLVVNNAIRPENQRVGRIRSFAEAGGLESLDLIEKNEGPGGSDLSRECVFIDQDAEILGAQER